MSTASTPYHARRRRQARIRSRIHGTADRPRLAVFRSLKHISAQLIDDDKGRTLLTVTDATLKKGTKSERATAVGKTLAEQAIAKKITTVVFDRGGNRFQGRIKHLADGARAGGLTF